jgi:hypothetical protein
VVLKQYNVAQHFSKLLRIRFNDGILRIRPRIVEFLNTRAFILSIRAIRRVLHAGVLNLYTLKPIC